MTERCPPELEDANLERVKDLLGHGIRIALVEGKGLGRLVASRFPATGHTVGCAMLAFVDKYIVLKGAIPAGLSICRSLSWSNIGWRTYGESNK